MNDDIEWVKKMDVSPGDIIVVRVKGSMSLDIAERIKEIVEPRIAELGAKLVVIDGNIDLAVLGKAD